MVRDARSIRLSHNLCAQRNNSSNLTACRSLQDSIATAAACLVGFEALVFFLGRDFLTAVATDSRAAAVIVSACSTSSSPSPVSSGLAKTALGTKLGRSSPLRWVSRSSRQRIRVVLMPTKTGPSVPFFPTERHSKRVLIIGKGFRAAMDSTEPGHHLPLPTRTIQTQTEAPGLSSQIR